MLGIIPVSGKSTRIKNKNLAIVGGKPLLQWTFEAVLASKRLTEICVSTENDDIAGFTRDFPGITLLEKRPDELSEDDATANDVAAHIMKNLDPQPESFCMIHATSPLRTAGDIDGAIDLFEQSAADCVISVYKNAARFDVCSKTAEGHIEADHPNLVGQNSQFWPDGYMYNGAMYVAKTEQYLAQKGFKLMSGVVPYEMPQERSLEVNTPFDLKVIDLLLSNN